MNSEEMWRLIFTEIEKKKKETFTFVLFLTLKLTNYLIIENFNNSNLTENCQSKFNKNLIRTVY